MAKEGLTIDVLRKIVAETKRYADSIMNTTIASGRNLSVRTMKWRCLDFDVPMLKRFLGLVMNMGLVVKKHLSILSFCHVTQYFPTHLSFSTL